MAFSYMKMTNKTLSKLEVLCLILFSVGTFTASFGAVKYHKTKPLQPLVIAANEVNTRNQGASPWLYAFYVGEALNLAGFGVMALDGYRKRNEYNN